MWDGKKGSTWEESVWSPHLGAKHGELPELVEILVLGGRWEEPRPQLSPAQPGSALAAVIFWFFYGVPNVSCAEHSKLLSPSEHHFLS